MPVSISDNIKISLSIYNLSGLIEFSSIKWHPPIIEDTPKIPKQLNSENIKKIDKNRICELEEMEFE